MRAIVSYNSGVLVRPAILVAFCVILGGLVFSQSREEKLSAQVLAAKTTREAELSDLSLMKIFWQGVVANSPTFRDGYLQLAIIHYKLGDTIESKSALQKVLELDPNYVLPTQLFYLVPLVSQ